MEHILLTVMQNFSGRKKVFVVKSTLNHWKILLITLCLTIYGIGKTNSDILWATEREVEHGLKGRSRLGLSLILS